MCPHVIYDEKAKLYRMWYSGGEQHKPNAIGYATSEDGLKWAKHRNNPIFRSQPKEWREKRSGDGLPVIPQDWLSCSTSVFGMRTTRNRHRTVQRRSHRMETSSRQPHHPPWQGPVGP